MVFPSHENMMIWIQSLIFHWHFGMKLKMKDFSSSAVRWNINGIGGYYFMTWKIRWVMFLSCTVRSHRLIPDTNIELEFGKCFWSILLIHFVLFCILFGNVLIWGEVLTSEKKKERKKLALEWKNEENKGHPVQI